MKNFLIALLLLPFACISQTYRINADSTRLYSGKVQGNELILENSTRTVQGFLYNYSANGRSRWQRPTQLNDTTIILGIDTFRIHDPEVTGGSISTAVDSIWRTIGKDSIQYSINGRYHSIKDSTGAVADTNFIRNQYAIKETKRAWFDTARVERIRFGSSNVVADYTTSSLVIKSTPSAYYAPSPFGNLSTTGYANSRIVFDAAYSGGSGSGKSMGISIYDSSNNRVWNFNSAYMINFSGAAIEANTFMPNRNTHSQMTYADGFVTNVLGTNIWDFATSGISKFKEFCLPIVAKTGTYTIVNTTDHTINCTSGTFTVTLPTAVGLSGRLFTVKNSGAGAITVACNGAELIDGAATYSLATQYKYVTVQSDNANWIIIGNN